jgi:hypothetical protein
MTHSLDGLNAHWRRNTTVESAKSLFLLDGAQTGNDGAEAAVSVA